MRKMTIAGFLAAAAIAAACGSGNNDGTDSVTAADPGTRGTAAAESKPAAATAKVGGTLTVNASGQTSTWKLETVEQRTADQYGMKPDNGGQWVLVEVSVKVGDGREVYVCSCDLSLISKSGKVYETGFASFKSRPDLTGATVAPGQNADGWVTFGVAKKDLAGARLQLKQSAVFDDTAFGYWTLPTK